MASAGVSLEDARTGVTGGFAYANNVVPKIDYIAHKPDDPIWVLPMDGFKAVAEKLNSGDQDSVGALAANVGISVKKFQHIQDPALFVLLEWSKQTAVTLRVFVAHLCNISRKDIIPTLQNHLGDPCLLVVCIWENDHNKMETTVNTAGPTLIGDALCDILSQHNIRPASLRLRGKSWEHVTHWELLPARNFKGKQLDLEFIPKVHGAQLREMTWSGSSADRVQVPAAQWKSAPEGTHANFRGEPGRHHVAPHLQSHPERSESDATQFENKNGQHTPMHRSQSSHQESLESDATQFDNMSDQVTPGHRSNSSHQVAYRNNSVDAKRKTLDFLKGPRTGTERSAGSSAQGSARSVRFTPSQGSDISHKYQPLDEHMHSGSMTAYSSTTSLYDDYKNGPFPQLLNGLQSRSSPNLVTSLSLDPIPEYSDSETIVYKLDDAPKALEPGPFLKDGGVDMRDSRFKKPSTRMLPAPPIESDPNNFVPTRQKKSEIEKDLKSYKKEDGYYSVRRSPTKNDICIAVTYKRHVRHYRVRMEEMLDGSRLFAIFPHPAPRFPSVWALLEHYSLNDMTTGGMGPRLLHRRGPGCQVTAGSESESVTYESCGN